MSKTSSDMNNRLTLMSYHRPISFWFHSMKEAISKLKLNHEYRLICKVRTEYTVRYFWQPFPIHQTYQNPSRRRKCQNKLPDFASPKSRIERPV